MHDAKVEHHPELIRRGGAIINTDDKEYQRALVRRKQQQRMGDLENRVQGMETMLQQMMQMVTVIHARARK